MADQNSDHIPPDVQPHSSGATVGASLENVAGLEGITVVLQGILTSLQRIERSLDGQREETVSLRKVLEGKSGTDGLRAGEERDRSGHHDQVESDYGMSDVESVIEFSSHDERDIKLIPLTQQCNVDDITGFQSLIGDAAFIPRDGLIELLFSKEYIESMELSRARRNFEAIERFVERSEESGNLTKVSIIDFVLNSKIELVYNWFNPQKIEGFRNFVSYFRISGDCPISAPVSGHSMGWGRIVLLHGLTTIKNSDDSNSSFPWYNDGHISLEHHFSCEELFQPVIYFDFFIIKRLQLTYFEFLDKLPAFEHWQTGYLYHRPYQVAKDYRKSCITITIYNNSYRTQVNGSVVAGPGAAGVIVIHAPTGFEGGGIDSRRPVGGDLLPMQLMDYFPEDDQRQQAPVFEEAIIMVLLVCVRNISENCNNTLMELNNFFSSQEHVTFMDPEKFVHHLYDDASFSRSRFYFWAIGCLSAFEENIIANRRNISAFKKQYLPESEAEWKWKDPSRIYHFREMDRKIKGLSQEMEDARVQLAKKLADIRALRDGLFSASGVMESRQSRILSENVRLLTYVSIFFLPLAFCVSLWSVPDISATWPGIRIPVSVAVVVGVITYLVVFNLVSLMWLGRIILSGPREYLIKKMAGTYSTPAESLQVKASKKPESTTSSTTRDPSHSGKAQWSMKAKNFDVFPRPDENPMPSDWWLAVFAIRLMCGSVFNLVSNLGQKLGAGLHIIKKPNSEPQNMGEDVEVGRRYAATGEMQK